MSELLAFIRARLDEDEQAALAAAQKSNRAWRYTVIEGEPDGYSLDLSDERVLIVDWTDEDELLPSEAAHIARHDPARVLREVEAKRKIIDEHFGFLHPSGNPDRACRRCSDRRTDDDPLVHDDRWLTLEPAPCPTLRLLALPYADSPDYREEWKP